jgi:hypothetical protein
LVAASNGKDRKLAPLDNRFSVVILEGEGKCIAIMHDIKGKDYGVEIVSIRFCDDKVQVPDDQNRV